MTYWIRRATPDDLAGIKALNDDAFGDSAEGNIVEMLWQMKDSVLSLVAHDDRNLVGHIEFYRLRLDGAPNVVGLGPMSARPDLQRSGIGSGLVRLGLTALEGAGETLCFVLGHPKYYPRFGFSRDAARAFTSPYDSPAFMAKALTPAAPTSGQLTFPDAFGAH